MVDLLFVCMGNICRSPTAEGVFRERVRAAGLSEHIQTDSAGTHDYHIGRAPDPRSLAEAARRGVDISDLRARQVDSFDYEAFDYLLAMDERNFDWLRAEAPRAAHERIKRFLEFAPSRTERWVPDPYYGGEDGFGHVFELVDEAATGLLAEIRQRHQL